MPRSSSPLPIRANPGTGWYASGRNDVPMNRFAVVLLLLSSTLTWAESKAKPADYTVNIHVNASRIDRGIQQLEVTIDGKKYELESLVAVNRLLALGDYKAKLLEEQHKDSYEFIQTYEFFFPDGKTRKFLVNGQTE